MVHPGWNFLTSLTVETSKCCVVGVPRCSSFSVRLRNNRWFSFSHMLDAALSHREGQDGETDRGDKSFSCGHPVWGLAFGPRPPKSAAAAQTAVKAPKGKHSLLLATGLENGVIKIWNVLTGEERC